MLSLLEDEHLQAHWGERLGTGKPYEDAIESALAKLRRLPPDEQPEAVVLVAQIPQETAEEIVGATVGISAVIAFDGSRNSNAESSGSWNAWMEVEDILECSELGAMMQSVPWLALAL